MVGDAFSVHFRKTGKTMKRQMEEKLSVNYHHESLYVLKLIAEVFDQQFVIQNFIGILMKHVSRTNHVF